jgi:hypothetical protein
LACYAWASPTPALGLIAGGLTLATGGRGRRVQGVLEFHGGFSRWMLGRTPIRASALTLGHVILGRDDAALDLYRGHEHIHVRQAERWGPAFVPAYLASSAWAWLRGLDPYLANRFEQEAYLVADGLDLKPVVEAIRRRASRAGPAPDLPAPPPDPPA